MLLTIEIPVADRIDPAGPGKWAASSKSWPGRACVAESPEDASARLKTELENWVTRHVVRLLGWPETSEAMPIR